MDPDSPAAKAILRTMVLMMLSDGDVAGPEVATIIALFEDLTEHRLTADEISEETSVVASGGQKLMDYLEKMASRINMAGKEMILTAATYVAGADGKFAENERQLLGGLGQALAVEQGDVDDIIERTMSKVRGDD